MLIKGRNYVSASNNVNTTRTLGCWIPQATEQNLIKFILHLYHEVQCTFSVLGDKIFPLKTCYQPLIFENKTGSEQKADKTNSHT